MHADKIDGLKVEEVMTTYRTIEVDDGEAFYERPPRRCAVSSAWIAAVTRSATTDGVAESNLPSRYRNASPWTSAQTAVANASASACGKVRSTIERTYSETAAVAATRSSLSRSHGSPNMMRNKAGRSSA